VGPDSYPYRRRTASAEEMGIRARYDDAHAEDEDQDEVEEEPQKA
jgi:hypothetical protein